MLANASAYLDRLFTARGAFRAIDRDAPAIDPLLSGHLLATDALVELVHDRDEAAEQSLRHALELFWKQNSFVEIARTSHRMAEIQLARGRVDEAHVLAREAFTFARRSEHVSMTSWADLSLGRTHMANSDREVSKEYVLQAERIARRLRGEDALWSEPSTRSAVLPKGRIADPTAGSLARYGCRFRKPEHETGDSTLPRANRATLLLIHRTRWGLIRFLST